MPNNFKQLVKNSMPFYRNALVKIESLERRVAELEETLLLNNSIRNLNYDFTSLYSQLLDLKLKYENPVLGSAEWLILTEYKYGGLSRDIKRSAVSKYDPRNQEQLSAIGNMAGGDRMNELEHNYAPLYARHLKHYIKSNRNVVLVEIGILKGTGLAIWSELFIKGRIIGLDINLQNIRDNMENLKNRGAFQNDNLELYEYDQFLNNKELLADILKTDKVDIIIDDGVHLDEPIITTLESFMPYLADDFLYIIEDNKTVYGKITKQYPFLNVASHGELTVIKP